LEGTLARDRQGIIAGGRETGEGGKMGSSSFENRKEDLCVPDLGELNHPRKEGLRVKRKLLHILS